MCRGRYVTLNSECLETKLYWYYILIECVCNTILAIVISIPFFTYIVVLIYYTKYHLRMLKLWVYFHCSL